MKKINLALLGLTVLFHCYFTNAQTVTISGYIYLEHQTNYSNIMVTLERTAPTAGSYTAYTDVNGNFTANVGTGIYNITYSKDNFYPVEFLNKSLFSNTTLPDTTLKANLKGQLSGTMVAGSYTVSNNIEVANGDTLIVSPGVKLLFKNSIQFDIYGLLIAEGTASDSIIFTQDSSGWSGIKFHNTANSNSILSYCLIEYSTMSGIYCFNLSPTFKNSTITKNSHNKHGGGIYCEKSSPIIQDVTISFNSISSLSSSNSGGGIYCVNKSNPTLTNVTISENSVGMTYGGGICCDSSSSPTLMDVIIQKNSVTFNGSGGGIACFNSSNPVLEKVTIDGNSAPFDGGGFFCSHSSPKLNNITIINNSTGDYGGGICCTDNSNPKLTNVTIINNSVNGGNAAGGGIYCYSSSPTLTNIKINNNSSLHRGGGIFCSSGSSPVFTNLIITKNKAKDNGGGVYSEISNINLINSTINNNSASQGGGIYSYGSAKPNLSNLIITSNSAQTGGGIYCDNSSPNITYCDVWNNNTGNFYICGSWLGVNVTKNVNGNNCDMYYNIQENPMFEDAGNGDYHLHTGSPCIDAGVNDSVKVLTDFEGNARIWDGDNNGTSIVDMGAYEVGIKIIGNNIVCNSEILSVTSGYSSYNWNNGLSHNDTLKVNKSGKYYVAVTNSKGFINYDTINVTINLSPSVPTVTTPVTYCQNATATKLTATGSNLLWYTTESGGTGSATAPIPSTINADTTDYYVSQTVNSCESQKTMIKVVINATPSEPTVTSPVTYCQNATAIQLTATGSNLLWYTTESGGTGSATAPTPLTTNAGTTDYYVSQTVNNCESQRATIAVTVNAIPSAPTVKGTITYCQNATAITLTAIGSNLLWYTTEIGGTGNTTAPTPSTASADTTSYYVSQTISGCESQRAEITVIINPIPATPTISLNGNEQLVSNAVNGNQWYDQQNGIITSATDSVFIPNQNGYYFVIVTKNGCQSDTSNIIDYIFTGINELSDKIGELRIYPNPTNNVLTIYFAGYTGSDKTSIELYSITGGLIKTLPITSKLTQINISDLSKGVYIIKVANDKTVVVKKVIKN